MSVAVVEPSLDTRGPSPEPVPVKIVVAGGFGVGKTTLVGAVSEITPLTSEAQLTEAGAGIDDISAVPDKTTTTVAMDFGRLTFDSELSLYLFGTPGQQRFWFMWDDIVRGAIGAIVLVDSRRLKDSFAAVDYFEANGMPFVVALNTFDGEVDHDTDDVRAALDVHPSVPVVTCDARNLASATEALIELVAHTIHLSEDGAEELDPAE